MTPRPTRLAGTRLSRPARSVLAGLTLGLAGVALVGCTAAVPLQPATDAVSPICADVVVHLPPAVADQKERETNAQGTGAWGTPASVLLHCGVDAPGPTTLPCVNINGIDWINDDSEAPKYRFTTYGRTPAVEVVVDSGTVSGSTVLADLTSAVALVPVTGTACTGIADLQLPGDAGSAPTTLAPTPSPSTAP
ncbi:DUF3515 family protein [Glaciibacter sp. 2TAF33]|uniref:DUF3515 family protein n=1 Tax=Glaciibacter sp. 2TAF33 TaxID=3233015 RepID=UPI003F929E0D